MTLPSGVPTVLRIVKNGSGGPTLDSIPVYDKPGGIKLGYVKNDTVIRICSPGYDEAHHYRQLWNNTTWVWFDLGQTKDLFPGKDAWCEETGHLVEYSTDPNPSPLPTGDVLQLQLITQTWDKDLGWIYTYKKLN